MTGAWRAASWLAICLLRPGLGLAGATQHTLTKRTPPLTSNEVDLGVCSQNPHPPSSLIPAATVKWRQNTHMLHSPTPLTALPCLAAADCLSD